MSEPPRASERRTSARFGAVLLSLLFVAGCMGGDTRPYYSKAQVQPITVRLLSTQEISLRYHVYPESSHYSGGVNYKKVGDELKVTIDRCGIRETCSPMAKTTIPLDGQWIAEVHIPWHGEKVIIVHADGDEPIYP